MLTDETRLTPKSSQVAAKVIDGEAIIMNLANGLYYSMDHVGAAIWQRLEGGEALGAIAADVSRRYGVAEDTARRDVHHLASELLAEELVDIADGPATSSEALDDSPGEGGRAYAAPVLNRYEDMADLLALDPPMPGLAGTNFDG